MGLPSMSETRIRLSGFLDPFLVDLYPNLAIRILLFYRQRNVDKKGSPREQGIILPLGLKTEDLKALKDV